MTSSQVDHDQLLISAHCIRAQPADSAHLLSRKDRSRLSTDTTRQAGLRSAVPIPVSVAAAAIWSLFRSVRCGSAARQMDSGLTRDLLSSAAHSATQQEFGMVRRLPVLPWIIASRSVCLN